MRGEALAANSYTRLTDIEQEANGLLYADRTSKCDMEMLSKKVKAWVTHRARG